MVMVIHLKRFVKYLKLMETKNKNNESVIPNFTHKGKLVPKA